MPVHMSCLSEVIRQIQLYNGRVLELPYKPRFWQWTFCQITRFHHWFWIPSQIHNANFVIVYIIQLCNCLIAWSRLIVCYNAWLMLCVYNICRADVNHDRFLDRPELKSWIMAKVQEHLAEASAENAKIFHHLDTDGDGKMCCVCGVFAVVTM